LVVSCSTTTAVSVATPSPTPTPTPSVAPLPCVQPGALPRTPGIGSSLPVVRLATGLNGPDDLLYVDSDGSVLVGEHGDGHIARVKGPNQLARLPQVVPEVEGIAQVGGVTYVADQQNNRVVALTDSGGVKTLIQLQPVPSGENLDGISTDDKGTGLVIPDSPHGVVYFVDTSGHITGRTAGFSRPAGSWPEPGGYLIADENAGAVFEIKGGRVTRLAGGLAGVDDAVRTGDGHVLVILPGSGQLRDVTAGKNVATGLRNPQGLDFDGAQNVLLTESDIGRVDLVVRTFAAAAPTGVLQLQPGQPVCIGLLRAPGYTAAVVFHEAVGADPITDPGTGDQGEVVPATCHQASCTATLVLRSGDGDEFVHFAYRD
jgi:hypothetical protein